MRESLPKEAGIPFDWLLRFRWINAGTLGLAIVAAQGLLRQEGLRVDLLLALVGVGALSNLALWWRLRTDQASSAFLPGLALGLDTLLLTGLLYLSGGPANPFTVLYLVHITLAAVVMRGAWAWGLGILSTAGFGLLFLDHVPVHSLMHMGHEPGALNLHLVGMWVAFAVAAALIASFVGRVARALRNRERELALWRERAARQAHLASLATLAAGVAHELATPLGTIAVASTEVHHGAQALGRAGEAIANDAALIRREAGRCRGILDRMAGAGGELAGEQPEFVRWQDLGRELQGEAATAGQIAVEAGPGGALVPRQALLRVLRALVTNALSAGGTAPVRVKLLSAHGQAVLEVEDQGCGMTPDVLERAGEPFFTTRPAGQGMGLGLFLARSLAEQLGGSFRLESEADAGTRVSILLPGGNP
jgi:two-component system sensor histidine kinase RegB